MTKLVINIGMDDFDSPLGGCTTYIASLLVEQLDNKPWIEFLDYPRLIRLNPNVPFKTRGNGAISLRLKVKERYLNSLLNIIHQIMESDAWVSHKKTDPVVVLMAGEIPSVLKKLYEKALITVIPLSIVEDLAEKLRVTVLKVKKGRGLVGAMAAIGAELNDYTYELLAYRSREKWGEPRLIDPRSVLEFDRLTRGRTFNNLDYESGRVLITPRGPDPVLFGVRGDDPRVLLKSLKLIKTNESMERWLIFKTNQGTDAHLRVIKQIIDVRPYDSVGIKGVVAQGPTILRGGHVEFVVRDLTGEMRCMVYSETGYLNKVARLLRVGDEVEVWGGARPPSRAYEICINVERIRIIRLALEITTLNPRCPNCGKRMKSLGKNKGFKCPKCGFRSSSLRKEVIRKSRILEPGVYIASPRAHRHLTRPLLRFGMKNSFSKMITPWHYP